MKKFSYFIYLIEYMKNNNLITGFMIDCLVTQKAYSLEQMVDMCFITFNWEQFHKICGF